MKHLRSAFLSQFLILVSLVLLSCAKPQVNAQIGQFHSADMIYLQRAGAEWDSLFNSGDISALVDIYAEDVISMPFNAPTVHGRAALTTEFSKFLSTYEARHETHIEEIIPAGDHAIERARYILRYHPRAGGDDVEEVGRHIMCRKKIEGHWRIVWELWNTES